ncbi:hypothetical protein [Hydrogenophaga pseudoflava]|uniref:hypothetical protein n=1 Tax=Hydrogenophaga pseudoflava TaxID=47421 RepID=UPI0027E53BD8|nr:hypothetical protein [Hydrogenophaga pseudoflava]MDQ7745656.1 hypothetical protein [Hydrogenophaga pseudoflava]
MPGGSRPTVVVVLSPHMVYSVTEWPRMKSAAEADGFEVVAWWLPDLTDDERTGAAERAGWPVAERSRVHRVPPECAAWVGRPNHYPYTRVLDQGRLHGWPIWGVMSNQAWLDSLRSRLHALRQPTERRSP